MKRITYWWQFVFLAVWIPIVISFFKIIDDRKVAALCAGIGFLLGPILFLQSEFYLSKKQTSSKVHVFFCLEFLFISAVPIFLLRVLNWESDFSELEFLGISTRSLHSFSNINYLILLASTGYRFYIEYKSKKNQP